MTKSTSAEKAASVAKKRRLRNKSVKSAIKTYVARAENLISRQDFETAEKAVIAAISVIDKAAKKGVIHPNKAARQKSRLMKKFNQAKLSSTAKKEK